MLGTSGYLLINAAAASFTERSSRHSWLPWRGGSVRGTGRVVGPVVGGVDRPPPGSTRVSLLEVNGDGEREHPIGIARVGDVGGLPRRVCGPPRQRHGDVRHLSSSARRVRAA